MAEPAPTVADQLAVQQWIEECEEVLLGIDGVERGKETEDKHWRGPYDARGNQPQKRTLREEIKRRESARGRGKAERGRTRCMGD